MVALICHCLVLKSCSQEEHVRFFNFGENIIRWLNLIGTNRRACIILENELHSKYFNLERGNAQGDTISPYIFNIGYQILLLKLNFDLQIAGLIEPPEVPLDIVESNREAANKVSTHPRKVFAFADDGNVLTSMDYASLNRIKVILEDFGKLSGLECNVEKTVLMPFGNTDRVPEDIIGLGFEVRNNITVLGLEIEGDSGKFDNTWKNITQKVRGQISHWSWFNLSLPGRINVAKTMMYSQINYITCFLPVPLEYLNSWSELIEKFALGNITVGKNRLYKNADLGGLGLFELDTFINSQRIAWITRASNLDEIWKVRLFLAGNGEITNSRCCFIEKEKTPVIYEIVRSYERFLEGYTKLDENFWESNIFENKALFLRLRTKEILTKSFFEGNFFRGKTANNHQFDSKGFL